MGVGQLSESDAVDPLRLPFYNSSHPTGSHGWRNQFDLGNPDLMDPGLGLDAHRLGRALSAALGAGEDKACSASLSHCSGLARRSPHLVCLPRDVYSDCNYSTHLIVANPVSSIAGCVGCQRKWDTYNRATQEKRE